MKKSPHICPWWMAYAFDNPLRRLFHKPERMLAPYVRPGMTVADIGCGMGYFSLGLARMVGAKGKVLAVDMQSRMLAKTNARAKRAGLSTIIETRLCDGFAIGFEQSVDFILAFWMVHETPDQRGFFDQVKGVLSPSASLLVAEPKNHVSAAQFDKTLSLADSAGLQVAEQPYVALSRAVILKSKEYFRLVSSVLDGLYT